MADQGELARETLRLAEDDAAAARAMQSTTAVSDAIIGFHAQQAVEKALKAVLAATGVEFPLTHDLGGLVELCEDAGITVPDELADVDRLSPYAVRLRYWRSDPQTVDRETAVRWAALAVEWATAEVRSAGF